MTSNPDRPRIVILTAGAGGMYCGSCLQDNTLASAMGRLGVDVQLIPMYTPIRTDEQNVSDDRILMGGINVYLQQVLPLFRYTPRFLDRVLDHPTLLRWAAERGVKTSAADLGPLTVSMLQGERGNQRKEVRRLCRWLADVRPSLVGLSNVLIGGCVPAIKRELDIPIVVTLQGDDIFLNGLLPKFREQAIKAIGQIAERVDGFLVHSRYYADYMSDWLSIDRSKFHVVPLGVQVDDFGPPVEPRPATRPPTIGYLARLAPEKGLHLICEAFAKLRSQPETADVELRIAGWLGEQHRDFVDNCFTTLRDANLEDFAKYVGEVDRIGKRDFLRALDVLSVPSPYREPKGIYVLEALACGVPVVQPDHGAFPELIESTGGGRLFVPDNVDDLARVLTEVLTNDQLRQDLAKTGVTRVASDHSAEAMATRVAQVMESCLGRAILYAD